MNSRREPKRISLSASQLARIQEAVAAEQNQDSDTSHLNQQAFIALCMGTTSNSEQGEYLAHLASCPECMLEYERLQSLGAIWQDDLAIKHLEERKAATSTPLPRIILDKVRLGSLMLPQGAYAEQAIAGSEPIHFPVCEQGKVIPYLTGAVKRRNREYYALITPADAQSATVYGDRSVRLTIGEDPLAPPLLQREIAVGVAVLLGTNLPLSAESYVEADLLPSKS